MYWFGVVLLAVGIVLLGCSNPWQFFYLAQGSFFDWTELFWYLQWSGFWSVAASLLVFGGLAWITPAAFAIRWRVVPAAIAFLLLAAFVVCSMPEKSNRKDWKDGWLGARVYWRTKVWLRADEGGEDALPERLAGQWKASGGYVFNIARDRIRIVSPGEDTVWDTRTCRRRFQIEYDFAFRQALERPEPGLAFSTLDQRSAASALPLPDRRFPRLSCSCDSHFATLVLVDLDKLIVFIEPDRSVLARRI